MYVIRHSRKLAATMHEGEIIDRAIEHLAVRQVQDGEIKKSIMVPSVNYQGRRWVVSDHWLGAKPFHAIIVPADDEDVMSSLELLGGVVEKREVSA